MQEPGSRKAGSATHRKHRNDALVTIDGHTLTLEQVEAVAISGERVRLHDEALARVRQSRKRLEFLLADGAPIYGVTTGFGSLASVPVAPADQRKLQSNLVRSHASGAGRPLPEAEVRAMMLLRANTLARGHSGCRPLIVARLLDLLNRQVHPVVPEIGSLGASGDLVPLAHAALVLMGEGTASANGRTADSAEVLGDAGIEPVQLAEKEGMALLNGTQACTGVGILALRRLDRALDTADVAGAMSLEGLKGTPRAFRAELHAARPHPGQVHSAQRLRALLAGSEIRESHRDGDPRVQDAYSLRCMPQVHGAAREAASYAHRVLAVEANSTTDNPLVLPESDEVLSGGNFHAQIVAQCLDLAAIAAADLAAVSERRTDRLLNTSHSGLPAFLTPRPGVRSGFMMAQSVAADALAEMRVLATPASIDSVPTSAGQEDHVSMGMAAARKFRKSVELLETVLAVELLCAAQAVEFHRPLRAGPGVERAVATVRSKAPRLDEDRVLSADLDAISRLTRAGAFASPAEDASR